MSAHSVADAKANLPRLIDRALGGEEVVITRHGKAVAELRAALPVVASGVRTDLAWLAGRRDTRPAVGITSVELLNQMYDEA